ncbi:MAG: cytochrome c oxidase subunit 3 [Gammaproteobacteria bacterium]|nr:cytochrome c oxidase subunit 3 [Gammaproteobacteria bacterium]
MSLVKDVTAKPWEQKGIIGPLEPVGAFDVPPEKVALSLFLAVAGIIFSLFTISYFARMGLGDWTPLAEPTQLWFNTGLLVISSIMFQWTRNMLKKEQLANIKIGLLGGGVFAVLFIAGQLMVWQNLQNNGFFVASNPANSFFYIFTGLHGIHLLGGLWVWSKTSFKLLSGAEPGELKLSIELCTIYWHFLLLVWLVMFGILSNT